MRSLTEGCLSVDFTLFEEQRFYCIIRSNENSAVVTLFIVLHFAVHYNFLCLCKKYVWFSFRKESQQNVVVNASRILILLHSFVSFSVLERSLDSRVERERKLFWCHYKRINKAIICKLVEDVKTRSRVKNGPIPSSLKKGRLKFGQKNPGAFFQAPRFVFILINARTEWP